MIHSLHYFIAKPSPSKIIRVSNHNCKLDISTVPTK